MIELNHGLSRRRFLARTSCFGARYAVAKTIPLPALTLSSVPATARFAARKVSPPSANSSTTSLAKRKKCSRLAFRRRKRSTATLSGRNARTSQFSSGPSPPAQPSPSSAPHGKPSKLWGRPSEAALTLANRLGFSRRLSYLHDVEPSAQTLTTVCHPDRSLPAAFGGRPGFLLHAVRRRRVRKGAILAKLLV
jgi:hypothetical protein